MKLLLNSNWRPLSFEIDLKPKFNIIKQRRCVYNRYPLKREICYYPEFLKKIKNKSSKVSVYDPHVKKTDFHFNKISLIKNISSAFDVIIFCVAHSKFKNLSFKNFKNKKIFDLNRVLSQKQIKILINQNNKLFSLGSKKL